MLSRLFATPEMLAMLAIVPVIGVLAWYARRRRQRAIAILGEPSAISTQVVHRARRGWRGLGWSMVLGLAVIAAAGPRWGVGPAPPTMPGCDVMLVVDVSRSMLARDALPSRLERAKAALGDLVDAVQARGGHRLGIVAFAGRAMILCPLTHDYDHVRGKIATLSADPLPPALEAAETSGTRIGAGIGAAIAALDAQYHGAANIVLVSDGDDPAGDEEWRSGCVAARSIKVPVFTVGIGDPSRDSPVPVGDVPLAFRGAPVISRLHEAPLREIAAKTAGSTISAGIAKPDLEHFVRTTINQRPTREAIAGTLPQPVLRQSWFLGIALGMMILMTAPLHEFVKIRSLGLAGIALLLVSAATAPDAALRRGTAALDAGRLDEALVHFAAAAERTTDPGLVAFNEGIALYHLGRYRESELRFRWCLSDAEGARRARALYNLGCALVQSSQGRRAEPLKQAMTALAQALARTDLDDELRVQARENLELAKRLLAQVPPEAPSAPEPPEPGTDAKTTPPGGDSIHSGETTPGKLSGRPSGERARNGKPEGTITDRHLPGKGSLPPLPDDDALAPLTPEDARAHLDRAAARIAAARQAQWRSRAATPSAQFPDW